MRRVRPDLRREVGDALRLEFLQPLRALELGRPRRLRGCVQIVVVPSVPVGWGRLGLLGRLGRGCMCRSGRMRIG